MIQYNKIYKIGDKYIHEVQKGDKTMSWIKSRNALRKPLKFEESVRKLFHCVISFELKN